MEKTRIITEPNADDSLLGRGKSPARLAHEILRNLENSSPYGLTFVDGIPSEHKAAIEAELKERFENWANSWVAPNLRAIILKDAGTSKPKRK